MRHQVLNRSLTHVLTHSLTHYKFVDVEGDLTRTWGPPFRSGESAYFVSINRNKQSIVVNLKEPQGIDIIKSLIKNCDILVENYVPNKMDEFGLSYEKAKEINPRLIYCSISGFGDKGKYKMKPGFDLIASALYGMLSITGEENSKIPVKSGVALTDICTGLFATQGIIAALYEREKSGLGQYIQTSLMQAQLATLANIGSNYLVTGEDKSKRHGSAHESIVPYQAFECNDGGSIVIGIGTDKQFQQLCSALQLAHLTKDDRFTSNKRRVENRVALLTILKEKFMERKRDDWTSLFDNYDFPFGPVRTVKEAFECEQTAAMNMVDTVIHPTMGPVRMCSNPVTYSRNSKPTLQPPPLLGQHTKEVLKNVLNYSDVEIQRLVDGNVVK